METVDIRVDGMSCGGCEDRLKASLERVDGVERVAADHRSGDVRVLFDQAEVQETRLRDLITDLGFDPVPTTQR